MSKTSKTGFVAIRPIQAFMMVEWLFLAVPWGCLRFVIVVFPDLFFKLALLSSFGFHKIAVCIFSRSRPLNISIFNFGAEKSLCFASIIVTAIILLI